MGGTFNPIHTGHLLLAENARSVFGLDEILFIPSGCSYMKNQSEIRSSDERLHMTELACSDNPHFHVSSIEIEREGYTYTCDTLTQLNDLYPENDYYFLVGADTLYAMESWRNPDIIFRKAGILAAVRDGKGMEELQKQADYLNQKYHARVSLIPSCNVEISSSEIRSRCRQGLSIRYMVPEPVRKYIEENKLYE